mgnify:CR=1 FL=1
MAKDKLARRESNLPVAEGYAADADAGFEHADAAAFSIPRFYMLQPLSPQVAKKGDAYVPGAEAGMIFNSVTKAIYPVLYVVPVLYRQSFVEWHPRDGGGGIVAEHAVLDPGWKREERGPFRNDANGTIVNDTRSFIVLAGGKPGVDADREPGVISMTATQIRRAMDWMTVMGQKQGHGPDGHRFRLPMFASVYELTGEYQENDTGNWYAWKVVDTGTLLPADAPAYGEAKALRKLFLAGKAVAEAPVADASAAERM